MNKLWFRQIDPSLYSFTPSDLWAAWLMLMGGLLLWWLTLRFVRREDRRMMLVLLTFGFLLRCGWAWTQHRAVPQMLYAGFAVDTLVNHKYCSEQANRWREQGIAPGLPRSVMELHVQALRLKTTLLYYVFGNDPLLPEAVTITAGASVILAVYLLALRLGLGSDTGRRAALVVAFLPSLVWYSTQDLRDPIETCAIAWSFLGFFGTLRRPRRAGLVVLLVLMDALALTYRPYVGLLLVGGQVVATALVLDLGPGPFPQALRILIIAGAFVIGVFVSVRETASLYNTHGLSFEKLVLAQSIREQVLQQAGSAYPIKVPIHGFVDAVLKLPILIPLLLLTPLPFLPGSVAMMATYPEMWFLYLWAVPNFLRGVRHLWREDRRAVVLLLGGLVPIVAAYSIRIAAAGVALRMRTQFLPILILIAALGAALGARRRLAQPTLAERYLGASRTGVLPNPPAG